MSNDNVASCGCPVYWVEHPTHPYGQCPYCEIARLRAALEEAAALIENVFTEAENETREYYSEWKPVLKLCKEALEER